MKIKIISTLISVLFLTLTYGQVTDDTNAPAGGNYVGFNNFSTIPLPIRNDGDPRINISSNSSNKFAITELGTWNGLNGLSRNRVQRTTLGLQGQTNLAWSMLHLWDDAAGNLPGAMQRPWMNVGTSYTSNIDFMYSGLLERPNAGGSDLATDAVIAWGCQPGTTQNGNTDNFRFIFLQGLSATPNGGSQTQQGLEMMRISPVGNVGIGDFSSNGFGLAEQPTQSLDVDGGARLRQLPLNDTADVFITGRQEDAVGDYVLTYTPFDDLNFDDCRWEDVNSATGLGLTDIRTGFDLEADCYRQNVVIGAISAKSKLAVEARTERDNSPVGVLFDITDSELGFDAGSNSGVVTALLADASGINAASGIDYVGIQSRSLFGRRSVGVDSRAAAGEEFSIGVYSAAQGAPSGRNIAYYGEVSNPGDVFLYQVGGQTIVTGPQINLSDETVKTNVEDIEGASSLLNQLQPKNYNYVSPENRPIAFDERMQYGLIAQEVLEVLPELVYETTVPEMRDTSGAFIEGTSVDLLGVNYEAFVPLLIAGFKEQNAEMAAQIQENDELEDQVANLTEQLENQEAQIAEMQEQMNTVLESFQTTQSKMNNCCGNAPVEKGRSETGGIELEQNFPNPFDTETTINFTLSEPAQIRLEISDASGRVLEVLVNTQLSEGQYTERWNASAYAPGTYYYSLYADTELLTKKMIKR